MAARSFEKAHVESAPIGLLGASMGTKDHGPSVKDDERYEKLRDKGHSKEKAARIANTDASKAGKRGGKNPPYEEWTRDELYERAQEIGVDVDSDAKKKQIIQALRDH